MPRIAPTPQEIASLPIEPQLGSKLSIPCRHCGKRLIPYTVSLEPRQVACPECKKSTHVEVYIHEGRCYIRTRP
jgi:phage FluMu protein Com